MRTRALISLNPSFNLCKVRVAFSMFVLAGMFFFQHLNPAFATADTPDTSGEITPALTDREQLKQDQLRAIEKALEHSRQKEEQFKNEIDALNQDISRLNAALIRSAGDIQLLEERMALTENRMADLKLNLDMMREDLQKRRQALSQLVRAMARLGRKPPPAIAVSAGDAVNAVRSAMIMNTLMPQLREQADELIGQLERLQTTSTTLDEETQRFIEKHVALKEERQRMALLLEERHKVRQKNQQNLAMEEARIRQLVGEAKTLQDLLASLDQARQQQKSSQANEQTETTRPLVTMEPSVQFADAKGLLPQPVTGLVTKNFGDDDGFGRPLTGLFYHTRAGAQVIAPSDGHVSYAGPFRSYGQLLILDVGQKFHIVMTGMERINVKTGQFVLMGEPIAQMGGEISTASAEGLQHIATDIQNRSALTAPQATLYIEFRHNNKPINPAPWWAPTRDQRISG
jgi:septal ring factor EnvC (AmiA/AmiB activator)